MEWCQPKTLSDLMPVFERLEHGGIVALGEPMDTVVQAPGPGAWLGIRSSGTTGHPKLIWRRATDLMADMVREAHLRGWTWASPFMPASYAGVQVALQAWLSQGGIITLDTNWDDNWSRLHEKRVDALSCTPTFADLLLQNEPLQRIAALPRDEWFPRQITLGGEPLRSAVGQRLIQRFPQTRFTVIYAAAELGILLKTHRLDGWYEVKGLAGRFPQWRIRERQLEVARKGEWRSTGDAVEQAAGLIRVIGRIDAVANVGGAKVSLAEVAHCAEEVPGVRRAVAVAKDNPITGQVVALKIELEATAAETSVLAAVQMGLRSRLRKEAWPREWEVGKIGLGPNSKREYSL